MAPRDDPYAGMQPVFATRLQKMISDAAAQGITIGIGSGYRTVEQQIALRKKNGCPDVWSSPASSCRVPTAIPGRSDHNKGLAADITGNKAWANANAAKYGLEFDVSGEDWHVSLAEDDESRAAAPDALSFNVNWADEARNPQDEVTSRLDTIMSIIGGSPVESGNIEDVAPAPLAQDTTIIEGGPASTRQRQVGGGAVPETGAAPAGKGVERWRGLAIQALQYAGEDPAKVDILLRRMNQESGGNPAAINRTDINAQRGTPSQGLMQTIPSTFQTHAAELAGRGILDPFANIVASIRYAKGRYGSLEAAYNRRGGY